MFGARAFTTFCGVLQANPADREQFPFVLLGNKVDQEGGRTRVVSNITVSHLHYPVLPGH